MIQHQQLQSVNISVNVDGADSSTQAQNVFPILFPLLQKFVFQVGFLDRDFDSLDIAFFYQRFKRRKVDMSVADKQTDNTGGEITFRNFAFPGADPVANTPHFLGAVNDFAM